jgi:sugar phosphate permease
VNGRRAYSLLALASLGYGCYLFAWFSIAAFLNPLSAELGLSNTAAGLLAGAVPLTYVPFALPSGLVIDRIGSRRAIGLGLVVAGLAHAGRGLVATFPAMFLLSLLLGVAGTGLTFGLPKLVSDLFPPERSGTMSSVYLVGLYAGTATAFGPGRGVLGPAVGGWRNLFLWSGLATLLVGAGWLAWTARLEGSSLHRNAGGAESSERAGSAERDGDGNEFALGSLSEDVRRVLTHRNLLLLVVVGTMYLFVIHGLQGWLTVVLESRGLAPALAGTVTSGLIVAQLAGTLVLPPLSDYLRDRRGVLVLCGLCIAAGTGTLVALSAAGVTVVALAVGTVGVGIGGLATLVRSLPIEMDGIGQELAGTAVGLVFTVGELGGFAGPLVIGVLEDLTGSFVPGLTLTALAGLVVVAAALPLDELDG